MINLEEIKERENKATPGPWVARKGSTCHHVLSDDRQFETGCINWNGKSPYDADFIAHARQDIPALIAEVARLQADSRALAALREAAQEDSELLDWLESQVNRCFGACNWYKALGDVHLGKKSIREALRAALAESEGA